MTMAAQRLQYRKIPDTQDTPSTGDDPGTGGNGNNGFDEG